MSEEKKPKEEKIEPSPDSLREARVENEIQQTEQIESVDLNLEKKREASSRLDEKEGKKISEKIAEIGIVASTNQQVAQKEREQKIEQILATDLDDIFLEMSPDEQTEFKIRGEETARDINIILDEPRTKIHKIVDLIKGWLRLIPAINRFFLEQEAKLKTDEILKLKR